MGKFTINQYTELTGRTNRTIKARLKGLKPSKKGKLDVFDSTEALPLIYDININNEDLDLRSERARLAKEQADGQSLKNAVSRQELAPIKLLEIALSEMSIMVCSKLESIPLKVKKNLPKLSAAEIEIITREINKALNEASKQELDFDRIEELLKTGG